MGRTCIGFWTGTVPRNFKRTPLIWDIDGTLLEPRGVGKEALNWAFQHRFGIPEAFEGLDFAGATDHDLFEQVCRRHGVLDDDPRRFFRDYVQVLRDILADRPLKALAGVPPLLAQLSLKGWPMGLGTGNIRLGAFTKLGQAGLAPYFPTGGFSHAGFSRADILRQAARHLPEGPALVIGDTPRDVEAAHQAGFLVLTVATGRFDVATLERAGADGVLPSLDAPEAFFEAIARFSEQKARA